MAIKDIYNSVGKVASALNTVTQPLGSLFGNTTSHYVAPTEPQYTIPPVIPPEHKNTFVQQAKLVGLTPDEFGQIAKREQGATTTYTKAKLIGQKDPTDRGVMQVNKLNEPVIQQRFKQELGRNYNPNDAGDSIIAARMILEENKKQFDQMRANKTFTQPYTNQDLIDSYNTGVAGLVQAKQGNAQKQNRLSRYQNAGK